VRKRAHASARKDPTFEHFTNPRWKISAKIGRVWNPHPGRDSFGPRMGCGPRAQSKEEPIVRPRVSGTFRRPVARRALPMRELRQRWEEIWETAIDSMTNMSEISGLAA